MAYMYLLGTYFNFRTSEILAPAWKKNKKKTIF